MVILPQNLSTGNGKIPGCSCILSVGNVCRSSPNGLCCCQPTQACSIPSASCACPGTWTSCRAPPTATPSPWPPTSAWEAAPRPVYIAGLVLYMCHASWTVRNKTRQCQRQLFDIFVTWRFRSECWIKLVYYWIYMATTDNWNSIHCGYMTSSTPV